MIDRVLDVVLGAVAALGVPAVLVWAFMVATDQPDVVFSYSSKQCVRVINPDGSDGSCDHLPSKFNFIWGE